MDTTTVLFWVFLTLTLAALAAAAVTGFRGRRRLHLVLAPLALVLLAVTIVLAERMASSRRFPPDEMAIHLLFAKSAALLVLPVVVTGLWLWRTSRGRRVHRVAVLLFFAVALTATGTGIWVFTLSEPR